MKFKHLYLNESFKFLSEYEYPHSGMARGPWIKISSRKYKHIETGATHSVGSIHAECLPASIVETIIKKG